MPLPASKTIPVGSQQVPITIKDVSLPDGTSVLEVSATVGKITYTERMTLANDNLNYSQAQVQSDFAQHCRKVANLAAARALVKSYLPNLT